MTAIALHAVTAGDGGSAAVRDLSLEVQSGEVVALLGANGSGKTTALRAVCGLDPVHSGRVELLGSDVTTAAPRARARLGLATVPDDRAAFSQLTVAENLRVGRRASGSELAVESWFPELVPLLRRRAGVLSGGEQTMVVLARALAGRPRAILVDELTAGLAAGFAEAAFSVLRRAAVEWGTAVLLAEQGAQLALAAADRVYVLRRGDVVHAGPPAEIAAQPGVLESSYLGDLG